MMPPVLPTAPSASGNLIKSTVGVTTTVYIAGIYEFIDGATDKVTKYDEGNAMRRSGYNDMSEIKSVMVSMISTSGTSILLVATMW